MKNLILFTIIVLSLSAFSCGSKYSNEPRIAFLLNLESGIYSFVANIRSNEADANKGSYKIFEDMTSKTVNEIRNLQIPNLEEAVSLKTQTIKMIDSTFKYDLKSPYTPKESVNNSELYYSVSERPVMKYLSKESLNIITRIKSQKLRFGIKD